MEMKHSQILGSDKMENSQQPPSHGRNLKDPDQAYIFLSETGAVEEMEPVTNLKALRRKIDWHIIPIMFLCYTMQFVDKVSLNYAAVMGLIPELKLKGNDF